ncbi:MAG: LacI family DNA-binding transcriptional regulator [Spirochaetes bacterium]|nr:LacI family DNA-binding transcriptional regulator [Spirochaetota bacterium]
MNVTIDDVAKLARVSTATVSRTINGNYPVHESTKKRVLKAIKDLDYHPNYSAIALATKSTKSIGVLIPGIANPYFLKVTEAIENTIYKSGYIMFLCDTKNDPEMERYYINNLLSRNVDGIIVVEGPDENHLNGFFNKAAEKINVVIINGISENLNCHHVSCDQEQGMRDALDYLISIGHVNIGLLIGNNGHSFRLKKQFFIKFMKQKNIPLNKENIICLQNENELPNADNLSHLLECVLNSKNRPTAFYVGNDLMSLTLLEASKLLGLSVPSDISIIGNDNIAFTEFCSPKLSTVDYKTEILGETSAKLLLNVIENKKGDDKLEKIVIKTEFINRESCASLK